MAKNKDEAKAEGYKRGLEGKVGTAGLTQGWRDDQAAGAARPSSLRATRGSGPEEDPSASDQPIDADVT